MGHLKTLMCVGWWLALLALPGGAFSQQSGLQTPTADRVVGPGWWPTKGAADRGDFVGSAACASCHKERTKTQQTTPMANSAMVPADSQFVTSYSKLSGSVGLYHYEIARTGGGVSYSVSRDAASSSVSLLWAFGGGEDGQTYVYSSNGTYYESEMSYFPAIQALDVTPGHSRSVPPRLEDTLGQPMDARTARFCFGCHTTASTTHYRFDPTKLIPGVTCEACHGPGSRHVAAMNLDPEASGPKFILNPATLLPVDSVEFCGACHRSRWDVVLSGATGPEDVRFQGYRLETSKCFGKGDVRLRCISCHDPHQPLVHESSTYDKACLACHAAKPAANPAQERTAAACPVKDKECVTCHMPKIDVASMHSKFTDHRIRIVQPGKPFPE